MRLGASILVPQIPALTSWSDISVITKKREMWKLYSYKKKHDFTYEIFHLREIRFLRLILRNRIALHRWSRNFLTCSVNEPLPFLIMALLSNYYCNYQNTQSEMLTSVYPNQTRNYNSLYPSSYSSSSYDSSRVTHPDNSAHECEFTLQKEAEMLDHTKDVVSESTKTLERYEKESYGVLMPVTLQR